MNKNILVLALLIALTIQANSQWQQTNGPLGGQISCLATNDTNIYAGTYYGGIFLTTDSGSNWKPIYNGLSSTNSNSLEICGSYLYSGLIRGMSSDKGNTWSEIKDLPLGDKFNGSDYVFALDEKNVFAGSSIFGVFLSTDHGKSWKTMNDGLTDTNITFLSFQKKNLLAGTRNGNLFLSDNYGVCWKIINNGKNFDWIQVITATDSVIYVANDDSIYTTSNYGANWKGICYIWDWFMGSPTALLIKDQYIFLGTVNGLYRSNDGGQTWNTIINGLTSKYVTSLKIYREKIIAGTKDGVYITENNGTDWKAINNGLINADPLTLVVSKNQLFCGLDGGGICITKDHGTAWTKNNHGLMNPVVISIITDDSNIYAGTDHGIYKSINNGSDWTIFGNPIWDVEAMAISDTNFIAGTANGSNFYNKSTNQWDLKNNGLAKPQITVLAVDGNNIYAGTNGGGVFSTNDAGTNWNQTLYSGIVSSILINDTDFFVAKTDGIFLSTDKGTKWTKLNNGLPSYFWWSVILVSHSKIFAGITGYGVYMSGDNGLNWKPVNQGLSNLEVISLAADSTYIYAGIRGAGVWKRSIADIITINHSKAEEWFSIFPNPCSGSFVIKSVNYSNAKFELVNSEGKIMQTINLKESKTEVNITGYSKGLYLIRLNIGKESITKKIIIN